MSAPGSSRRGDHVGGETEGARRATGAFPRWPLSVGGADGAGFAALPRWKGSRDHGPVVITATPVGYLVGGLLGLTGFDGRNLSAFISPGFDRGAGPCPPPDRSKRRGFVNVWLAAVTSSFDKERGAMQRLIVIADDFGASPAVN